MTPLTRALIVYSVQVGLLIVVCAIAARAIDLAFPRARLAYWRAVIALSLLLPLWPAHVVDVAVQATPAALVESGATSPVAPTIAALEPRPAQSGRHPSPIVNWLPALIAAGVVTRLAWLATGLLALRRLAAAGDPVADADVIALQRQIAPEASVRWHDAVGQPVTFGARHPIVLLPRSLRGQADEIRRAALCHELFHAARGDWAAGLLEESIASLFWFHPAMRWAIGQAQLCREQQVDELSIIASGSRRGYLQALFEFSEQPAIRTAEAFGRSRQLARRIKHLSREVVMSRSRFGFSTAALATVIATSTWTVASALPLRVDVRYHTSDGGDRRESSSSAPRAERNLEQRPIDDAPMLAVQHARQQPPAPTFQPPPGATFGTSPAPVVWHAQAVAQFINTAGTRPVPAYPDVALQYGVGATVTLRGTVTQAGYVVDVSATRWSLTIDREIHDAGYWLTAPQKAFIDSATAALQKWSFQSRTDEGALTVTFNFSPEGRRVVGSVELRASDGTIEPRSGVGFVQLPGSTSPDASAPVRVGGSVRPPRAVSHAAPVYPPVARDAGVQGIVVVEIIIGTDGSVTDARILKSIPLLDQAALDAVRQWEYEPTIKDGVAVPVTMTVTVNFRTSVF